jgi:hypothetical protein
MELLARVDELDLLVNPGQPFLGPRGSTLGLLDLPLQLIDAVLGHVQLKRKLACQLIGTVAGFVRQVDCLDLSSESPSLRGGPSLGADGSFLAAACCRSATRPD